jgi:hypothetical protein
MEGRELKPLFFISLTGNINRDVYTACRCFELPGRE